MTLDAASIIAGAIFGFGIGIVTGFFLGLYSHSKTIRTVFNQIRQISAKK